MEILKKYRERKLKKREDFKKMLARVNAKEFVRDGCAQGDVFIVNSQFGETRLLYLYSKLDEDWWLNLNANSITSTKEGVVVGINKIN